MAISRFFCAVRRWLRDCRRALAGELLSGAALRSSPEEMPRSARPVRRSRQKDRLGARGEEFVCARLREAGYLVLERNIILGGCEIDILADDAGTVVFIEVKTRTDARFGDPEDAVDERRRLRMIRASKAWRRWRQDWDSPIRFDIVAVLWPAGADPAWRHIKNAFDERVF